MEWWREFNSKWESKFNLSKRYPYYITKPIFNTAFIIIFALVGVLVFTDGFSTHYYQTCKDLHPCVNVLYACRGVSVGQEPKVSGVKCYTPTDENMCVAGMCDAPYIEPGQYVGQRPSFLFENFPYFMFGILALAFLINHLSYLARCKK